MKSGEKKIIALVVAVLLVGILLLQLTGVGIFPLFTDISGLDYTGYNETLLTSADTFVLPRSTPVKVEFYFTIEDGTHTQGHAFFHNGGDTLIYFPEGQGGAIQGPFNYYDSGEFVCGCGSITPTGCHCCGSLPSGVDCKVRFTNYYTDSSYLRGKSVILGPFSQCHNCNKAGGVTIDKIVAYQAAQCNDGLCEGLETAESCPYDCTIPQECGDGNCDADENCQSCPSDCGACPVYCGDRNCDLNENCATCPYDCGICPPSCGDGTCNFNENCSMCPQDCDICPPVCGDRECNGAETCSSCPSDCGVCPPSCGDGTCGSGETCTNCPSDCGQCQPVCGNGACNSNENCQSCPSDCGICPPSCGDGECNGAETCSSCPQDCGMCPPIPGGEDYDWIVWALIVLAAVVTCITIVIVLRKKKSGKT